MNHLDLFSGIGGFSLAAKWVWGEDHNIVAFVEQDKYCQKVLNKHWPNVPIIDDIRNYTYDQTQTVDLLTGGFPCQPFSIAGKRKGKSDDRYLWPEMFRVIQETKSTWIVGENVHGIINMGLETTVLDLEAEGYEVELLILPACGVGAWHQRYRVFILANSQQQRLEGHPGNGENRNKPGRKQEKQSGPITSDSLCAGTNDANTNKQYGNNGRSGTSKISQLKKAGIFKGEQWTVEPDVGRVAHGISSRVDRLKGLGNAIVPQVVYPIMYYIKQLQGD